MPLSACGGLTMPKTAPVHFLHIVSCSPRGPVVAAKRNGPCRVAALSGRPATDTAGTVAFKRDRLPSEIEWKL
jgi:hypothetical protein